MNNKKLECAVLLVVGALIGFILGYFAHLDDTRYKPTNFDDLSPGVYKIDPWSHVFVQKEGKGNNWPIWVEWVPEHLPDHFEKRSDGLVVPVTLIKYLD